MLGPYSVQESLYWLRKYFIKPAINQPFFPAFPNQKVTINTDFEPLFGISFVGDLMSLHGHQLELGPQLKRILNNNKYVIVNLEAPLTLRQSLRSLKQFNQPNVLDAFLDLIFPRKSGHYFMRLMLNLLPLEELNNLFLSVSSFCCTKSLST